MCGRDEEPWLSDSIAMCGRDEEPWLSDSIDMCGRDEEPWLSLTAHWRIAMARKTLQKVYGKLKP
jgi:hypothetical protein